MTNEFKPGFVRNIENQICGYDVSPTICIPFTQKEIEETLLTHLVNKHYLTKEKEESIDIVSVLREIRQEIIDKYPKNYMGDPEMGGNACCFSLNVILDIIDGHISDIGGTE